MKRAGICSLIVATACGLLAASSVAAGSLPTLTVALTRNGVSVGGATVSGAVNVAMSVSGEAEDSVGLILLKPGVTAAQFGAVAAKVGNGPLDAIDPYGTIVFFGQGVLRGKPATAQADLPAGNYVAVNNGNGFATFTVTASSNPAALPKPGGTVKAIDFGYRGASTLRDGELVRFENAGYLIHMVLWGRLKRAADVKPAEALLLRGKIKVAGQRYVTDKGQFAGPLSHGAAEQEVISQPPGTYIVLCEMSAQDGRDHYQLGMFRAIRIVK